MERQEKKEDSKKDIYPKNNDNHPISKHKYKKPSANKKFIKNPHISYLNINSHFIYSENDFQLQLEKLKNKNLIKLTKNEEEYLRNLINEISIFHSLKNNEQFIEINANMYDKINNFKKIDTSSDQLAKYIKEKILSNNSRIGISCRKLAASYTKDTGNPVGKSTIQKIIRHKLGYRYLKTVKKSNYLASDSGVCSCLVFIKIVVKALIQDTIFNYYLIYFYCFHFFSLKIFNYKILCKFFINFDIEIFKMFYIFMCFLFWILILN